MEKFLFALVVFRKEARCLGKTRMNRLNESPVSVCRWKSGHAEQQEEEAENEDGNGSILSSDDDLEDSGYPLIFIL